MANPPSAVGIDPTTGKPWDFSSTSQNPWNWNGAALPTYGVDASPANFVSGVNSDLLNSLGYDKWAAQQPGGANFGSNFGGVDSGQPLYDPTQDFLSQKGYSLASRSAGAPGQPLQNTQAFDASGNPVGKMATVNVDEDPGNLGMMLGFGMLGLGMGGALSAAGAGGSDAGMSLAEGAYPSDITGGAGVSGGDAAFTGSDAHFLSNPGDLGNMGGAGSATVPTLDLGSTPNWLQDAGRVAGKLMGGSGKPGQVNLGGLISGGMSAGDRYRQQQLATALRDSAQNQQQQYSAGPGWIPGG